MSLPDNFDKQQPDSYWKDKLSKYEFDVLRNKATEPPRYSESTPGALEYELKKEYGTKYPKGGSFVCAACGTVLYHANTKFDSGCGWPSFFDSVPINSELKTVEEVPDADGRRVEIICRACKSHLGHVFRNEGFNNPTNERHCVNGISVKYVPDTTNNEL